MQVGVLYLKSICDYLENTSCPVGERDNFRGRKPSQTQVQVYWKFKEKFNSNSNGADTAYNCKQSAYILQASNMWYLLKIFQQKLHLLVNSQ